VAKPHVKTLQVWPGRLQVRLEFVQKSVTKQGEEVERLRSEVATLRELQTSSNDAPAVISSAVR
jgi:hypothetical protein